MNRLLRFGVWCVLFAGVTLRAQDTSASPLPAVPTTKILAIGRLAAVPTAEQMKLLGQREVPATVRLYLAGKIDQWYTLKNGAGVVFVMNVTTVEEAHGLLEALPLGQAHLMTFELIPIGPLAPLGLLLQSPTKRVP